MSSCNRTVINRKRVVEALNGLVACLPAEANVSGLAALINSCCTLEDALALYALAAQRGICLLQGRLIGDIPALGQDYVFTDLVHGIDNLYIYSAFAGSFTFPVLEDAQRGFYISYEDNFGSGSNMSFLRFVSAPVITFIQDHFFVGRCPLLESVTMPLLDHVGSDFNVGSNDRLVEVDIHSLTFLGGSFFASGALLTGLQVPLLATWNGPQWMCDANSLPTADVNALLIKFDSLGVVGRTINFAGGGNGPPTGAGLTAQANLILAGNTVLTN